MQITVESESDLLEFLDWLDKQHEPEMLEQITTDWKKRHSLSFAKVGVFNPYTLEDWKKVIEKARNGTPLREQSLWFLDQWAPHPVRLSRLKVRNTVKHRGKWTMTVTNSPLYLTPHALARYRERTGLFVNPSVQCWNIPYIPNAVTVVNDQIQTNTMLPTLHGAWLGYTTQTKGSYDEVCSYDRKRGLRLCQQDNIINHFYAVSFISKKMMSSEQLDIVDAYDRGDYDLYTVLQKEHSEKYPNSIFSN
jgi:hypothetical protein